MNTLSELWAELGDRAGVAVVALFHRLRDLGATDAELRRALSMLITAENTHAGATAEGVAREQLQAWGAHVPTERVPLGDVATHLDGDRLGRAVGTVLERITADDVAAGLVVTGAALHRLGRSEAVATGQASFRAVMVGSDDVGGWTRDLEPDACELCVYWYASGREWTKHKTMPKHTGCTCAQTFTTA